MTLRDLLIIGAQMAGTTTLYRDLVENPTIFLPTHKEPGNLSEDGVLTDTDLSADVTGAAWGHIGSSSIG